MDASSPDSPTSGQERHPPPVTAVGRDRRTGGRHRQRRCSGPARICHSQSPSAPEPESRRESRAARRPACHATPMTTTAPAVTPASGVMLCRDAWGAQPPRPGGIPHTLTQHDDPPHRCGPRRQQQRARRLRQHQHYHQDTQGWIDIAYHVSVDRNGNIYRLRDPISSATPRRAMTRLAISSLSAKETSTKRR